MINQVSSGGEIPCYINVHPNGKSAYIANYGSGTAAILPIHEDGSLGEPLDILVPGIHAHMFILDPTSSFAFIPCLGSDYVKQLVLNKETGEIIDNKPHIVSTTSGAGPRILAFHPTMSIVYLINELNNTILTFQFNTTKGTLEQIQVITTLPSTDTDIKSYAGHIVVSHSGKFVYASNRGHDSIVIFSVNSDGTLTNIGFETNSIKWPRHFIFDPTNKFLLVANQKGNSVSIFAVDDTTGKLTYNSTHNEIQAPSFLGFLV